MEGFKLEEVAGILGGFFHEEGQHGLVLGWVEVCAFGDLFVCGCGCVSVGVLCGCVCI